MEPDAVRAVVDAYVDAMNRNDEDAYVGLFAPDAVFHDPVGQPPHVGHDGIRAFYRGTRALASDITLTPSDVIVCGTEAVMVFGIRSRVADSEVEIDAVDVFELRDDARIERLKAYWDLTRARTRAAR